MKTYKGFNKNMTAKNGYQYEEGKEYEEEKAAACECGFHACEYPLDCFSYYNPGSSVYHVVEQSGEFSKNNDDSKVASTKSRLEQKFQLLVLLKRRLNIQKIEQNQNVTQQATTAHPPQQATAAHPPQQATKAVRLLETQKVLR